MNALRIVRDHPPMLIDEVSATTKRIVGTFCECCGDYVSTGRPATRAEQDAHAGSCKGHQCRSKHDGAASKGGGT